jgi:predicted nucleotidyltransferase
MSLAMLEEAHDLLGFSNRWLAASIPHAARRRLPNGATIRALSPPYLLATKLEAFASRGAHDYVGSRDFADVIAVVDGREELVAEVRAAPEDIRVYIATRLGDMTGDARFLDGIVASLRPDAASQARAESVVLPRLRALASLTG